MGQKNQTTVTLGSPDYLQPATLQSFAAAGTNSQITDTYYDSPAPAVPNNTNGIATLPGQSNLRKRVAASTYTETQGSPVLRATYYNYDLDGNVKTLWQQVDGLYQSSTNTGLKRIDYEYDLVSGKVNFVRYQDGQPDKFYYSYTYDADNRITGAWSSPVAVADTAVGSFMPASQRRQDAAYTYYLHGPLQRMVLGNDTAAVQGVDYAYTLQGWLKGVNSTAATATADMGQDGADLNHKVARDAYGYSLGYYTGDYQPIGGSAYTAFALQYTQNIGDITGQSLYNGNISNSTLAINQFAGGTVGCTYHYDQLNRLKKERQYPGISGSSWSRANISLNYQENVTYDGNGNILTYGRNGAAPTAQTIDSLTYNYSRNSNGQLLNNQLQSINDAVATSNYTLDLTNQTDPANYRYDAIGNLIYDTQSGITGNDGVNAITWSVYNKILSIYKAAGTISYTYNPAGQRVSKTAAGLTTWYIRDAQGNTLAVYNNAHSTTNWMEQHLYGSSRIGMWTPNVALSTGNEIATWDTIGKKLYELTNHLGNVLETLTDKRLQHSTNGTSIDYFNADAITAQDYYPFGMLQPGRQYAINTATYRYGFNGKENDNEVKGVGNQQNYGERISDPRVGRFLSRDPLSANYPWYTPYQFAGNNPIAFIDRDGLEELSPTQYYFKKWTSTLKKSEWSSMSREFGWGDSFADANVYNTQQNNFGVYQPIRQIHQYYVWAASEISKTRSNIKFFEAAADVTDATNVGMLFTVTKFTKDYPGNADLNRELGEVNKELLKLNFPVIKAIINNGTSDVVPGNGIMFDLHYVEREQKGLTQTMERLEGKNSTFSNISKHLTVNSIFNTGGRLKEYVRAGNALTGNVMIDYSDERQRIGFGRALVFIKHLEEDKNFVGSSAYKDAVDFLIKDYGKANVDNFLKTVGANEDKK